MPTRTLYQKLSLNIFTTLMCTAGVAPAHAQLNQVIYNVFEEILVNRVQRTTGPLGTHSGNHFLTSADVTNSQLAPALNSFIANDITSFPIPTIVPNMTFRMSAGSPVAKMSGLGPIFAEPAETLGKGVLNLGVSVSHLNFAKMRGIPTNDLQLVFTHRDLTNDGTLGDIAPESDAIMIDLNMDLEASISALVATLGMTNALDFGVAVPLIATTLQGKAKATIESYTLANFGTAVHRFGGDDANPLLQTTVPYRQRSFGLGDVALRLKYNFLRGWNLKSAALLELRLPTGKTENFMGTGETTFRLAFIAERRFGDLTPHLNLGFNRRSAGLNNDRFEFKAGGEQRIKEGLNFVADLIGAYDLNQTTTIAFPSSIVIHDHKDNVVTDRLVELSNVPNRAHDNKLDAALGFKFAPSQRMALLGNVLIPLNQGGLRSSFVPTLGFSMNY